MSSSLAIAEAVDGAAEVIEHFADAAIARIVGDDRPVMDDSLRANLVPLTSDDLSATDDEMTAAARLAGVTGRKMTALGAAPGLPQSLIVEGTVNKARAKTLPKGPLWSLAGGLAMTSERAVKRVERFNDWVRSVFLLLEGRLSLETSGPRALWTLVYGEAAASAGAGPLAAIASDLARAAPACNFGEELMCCEHGRRLGLGLLDPERYHPLQDIPLSGAERYGLTENKQNPKKARSDLRPYLFPSDDMQTA